MKRHATWSRKKFATLAVLLFSGSAIALAACSSTPEVQREAGNLGTRVCINNMTNQTLTVQFDRADTTKGAGQVPYGAAACAEGTYTVGVDVRGTINAGKPDALNLTARNLWIMSPEITIESDAQGGVRRICLQRESGDGEVGTVKSMSLPTIKAKTTRLSDDQWKEFTVDLTNGDGVTRGNSCNA